MLRSLLLLAALAFVPVVSHAHDAAPTAAPMGDAIKAEFHAMLKDAETKVIELAEATPADKFTWSPGKGVRSTSEVFMHVAGANYLIPTFVGAKAPEGIDPTKLENEIKDKDAALKTLRESFVSAHAAIDAVPVADLDTKIKMFGMDVTKRYALLLLVAHAHEHLGQSIAYARMNAITPPWTARAEAKAAAKQAESGK
jgi:uncharacterized damage-inducible protein DinB